MINKETKEVLRQIIKWNSAGYFYNTNCRINYSSMSGWYCKDYDDKTEKIHTYNVTSVEAIKKVSASFL